MNVYIWYSSILSDWSIGTVISWGDTVEEALESVKLKNEEVYAEIKGMQPESIKHRGDCLLFTGGG